MMQNAATHDHQLELQAANKEIFCITKWGKPTKMCSPLETHPSPREADLELDIDLELEELDIPTQTVVEQEVKRASFSDIIDWIF